MSIDNDPLWDALSGKKWPKYKGELKTPIDIRAKERLIDAFLRKCNALALFYGTDPEPTQSNLLRLFFCLACHHVPGFRLRKLRKPHSNKLWTDDRFEELITDVETVKRQKHLRWDREALDYLIANRPYSVKWGKSLKKIENDREKWKETLESRLQDAKKLRRKRLKAEALYREMLIAELMKDGAATGAPGLRAETGMPSGGAGLLGNPPPGPVPNEPKE